MPLEEILKLEGQPVFQGESSHEHPLKTTTPSRSGLQWIAVPSSCIGLFYRIEGATTLQSIRSHGDELDILFSAAVPVPIVHLAASDDGRLVCLACADGSLRCYNATKGSFSERWTLPNAHSHVLSNLNESVNNSRDVAASAAGPVRSLQFQPQSYTILLVDAGRQTLQFFDGDSTSQPSPRLIDSSFQITCAAWAPTNESILAIGKADGIVEIYQYRADEETLLVTKSQLDAPEEEDDEGKWACTHLQWLRMESLAAGYCRVKLPGEEEADDEQEADDDDVEDVEHEASFYMFSLSSSWTETNRTSLGDVVAFFSVPRNGRHVFYSCCAPTNQTQPVLLVASNVSSDVAVIALEDGEFQIIDIPEGNCAAAPTDADDEFTFPVGIGLVTCVDGNRLLLDATDGSLSSWKLRNEEDSGFFPLPAADVTVLPSGFVEARTERGPPDDVSGGGKGPSSADSSGFGSGFAAPNFGGSTIAAFGSGTQAPSFGNVSAFSFGTSFAGSSSSGKDSSTPSFGITSSLGSSKPVFGMASSLGTIPQTGPGSEVVAAAVASSESSKKDSPVFGAGKSAPIFGSSTPKITASPGFGGLATSAPLNAFGTSPAVSPASAFAKPLFGSTAKPTTESTISRDESSPMTAKASSREGKEDPLFSGNLNAKRAAESFDVIDVEKTGKVSVSRMEDILEELGEGFHGEELDKQVALIDDMKTGFLQRDAFIEWYMKLCEDAVGTDTGSGAIDLDSEDEEEWEEQEELVRTLFSELEGKGAVALNEDKFPELIDGLGSTYCEEGEHGRAKKKLTTNGVISIGSFLDWYKNYLFGDDEVEYDDDGETDKEDPAVASGDGKTVKGATSSAAASKSGGFIFDGGKVDAKATGEAEGASHSAMSIEAKRAACAFDLYDQKKEFKLPVSKMEDILEELGEGFHGEELDKQVALIDGMKSGFLQRDAFIKWYVKLSEETAERDTGSGVVDLDSEDEQEWEEQVELVRTLFSELEAKGAVALSEDKFPELIDGLGSTYCEEGEHGRAKKSLTTNGMISIDSFLDWYKSYLFGDDEVEYDDDGETYNENQAVALAKGGSRPKANWGNLFKIEEGSWKCDVCGLLNKPNTTKCAACEAPRPGTEASKEVDEEKETTSFSYIGSSGFTFGGGQGSSNKSSESHSTSSIGSSGFVFGGATVNKDRGLPTSVRFVEQTQYNKVCGVRSAQTWYRGQQGSGRGKRDDIFLIHRILGLHLWRRARKQQ